MLTHVLRYDDLSGVTHPHWIGSLVQILLEHRMPCTFAVVPFACDPASLLGAGRVELRPFNREAADMLKPLLAAGLAQIALHGYSHLAVSYRREHEEFSDAMPEGVQRSLIRAGREHLQEVFQTQIRLFVPPWNRFGRSTAAALAEEGMNLSAGFVDAVNGDAFDIPNLPCTVSVADTKPALEMARRLSRGDSVVGTILHDYDFMESGYGEQRFTLEAFEGCVADWLAMTDIARPHLSDAIDACGREPHRATSNAMVRRSLRNSRLGRMMFRKAGLVYWDAQTANHLRRRIGWLF